MILHNGDVLFGWPLQSHVITAGWFYNDGSLHRALDFRAAVGTPVYAAEGGTVETAYRWNGRRTQGDTNSYGNMLKLRHADYRGGRLETLYAHLSKLCVAQGETVYEGQLIGYSGDTGNCYGAHPHFEVRWKGPSSKHCVVNKDNGDVLFSGYADKALAIEKMNQHIAAIGQ